MLHEDWVHFKRDCMILIYDRIMGGSTDSELAENVERTIKHYCDGDPDARAKCTIFYNDLVAVILRD